VRLDSVLLQAKHSVSWDVGTFLHCQLFNHVLYGS
jgi:hypothetical protein